MEYGCRIQPFYKLNGLTTKHALKGLLPEAITGRQKPGFYDAGGAVAEAVHAGDDRGGVLAGGAGGAGFFDAGYVRQMLDEHFENRRDHRKQLYPLLCFAAWLRIWVKG